MRRVGRETRVAVLVLLSLLAGLGLQSIERLRFARVPRPMLGPQVAEVIGGPAALGLTASIVLDVVVLSTLLLLGGLLVPRSAPLGPSRPAIALLTGIGLQIAMGLLLLGWLWSTVGLVVAAASGGLVLRRQGRPGGWGRADLGLLATSAGVIAVAAIVTRGLGLAVVSADSHDYLSGARALSQGTFAASQPDIKRMLAMQSLHALGFGPGASGLLTLGPVLLVASVVLIALLPRSPRLASTLEGPITGHHRTRIRVAGATAAVTAVLVAGSSWFAFMTAYINSHLLVAVLLLVITILSVIGGDEGDVRHLMVPIAIALVAVALARAEAVLIIGLLLLGTLTDADRWRDWWPAWWAAGTALVVWNALVLVSSRTDGQLPLVAMSGIGFGIALTAAPAVLSRLPDGIRRTLPLTVGTGLWALVLLLSVTPVGAQVVFAEMVRANLGHGEGEWFLTAPLVAIIGAFAVAATTDRPSTAPSRWLLIGFIPATMLAMLAAGSERLEVGAARSLQEVLLSGGGRPGWGDSVNRMWTHVALVALVLAVVAAIDLLSRRPHRPAGLRASSIAFVALTAVTIVWWQPDLGPDGPPVTTMLASSNTEIVGPDLTAGSVLTQHVPIAANIPIAPDARSLRLCIEVSLTDLDRRVSGSYEIALDVGPERVTRVLGGDPKKIRSFAGLCLTPPLPLPDRATVTLSGVGGTPGGTVAVLVDADGSFVRRAALDVDAASTDPRGSTSRVVSWTLRRLIENAPLIVGAGLGLALVGVHRPGPAPSADRGLRTST